MPLYIDYPNIPRITPNNFVKMPWLRPKFTRWKQNYKLFPEKKAPHPHYSGSCRPRTKSGLISGWITTECDDGNRVRTSSSIWMRFILRVMWPNSTNGAIPIVSLNIPNIRDSNGNCTRFPRPSVGVVRCCVDYYIISYWVCSRFCSLVLIVLIVLYSIPFRFISHHMFDCLLDSIPIPFPTITIINYNPIYQISKSIEYETNPYPP